MDRNTAKIRQEYRKSGRKGGRKKLPVIVLLFVPPFCPCDSSPKRFPGRCVGEGASDRSRSTRGAAHDGGGAAFSGGSHLETQWREMAGFGEYQRRAFQQAAKFPFEGHDFGDGENCRKLRVWATLSGLSEYKTN